MHGAAGLQQRYVFLVCGKVPYRLSGGFRPVKHIPALGTGAGLGHPSACPYKYKGFELSRPAIEAHLRKRKREGLTSIFGSVRSGCTGLPLTESGRFRAVSERVQLQK